MTHWTWYEAEARKHERQRMRDYDARIGLTGDWTPDSERERKAICKRTDARTHRVVKQDGAWVAVRRRGLVAREGYEHCTVPWQLDHTHVERDPREGHVRDYVRLERGAKDYKRMDFRGDANVLRALLMEALERLGEITEDLDEGE